jgi:peptide/nickel transport system substrate-binding protein
MVCVTGAPAPYHRRPARVSTTTSEGTSCAVDFEHTPRRTGAFAVLACVSLLAAACGGTTADDGADNGDNRENGGALESAELTAEDGESGLDEAGEPVRGDTLTYGQEADTNGGFCLSEAQLAISGMMVVRAIYDTLTVPNAEGEFVPYLAKSVEPNDDFTEWDITVREGIQFHDGSDLDAEVVKNNIDAYRGEYEGRSSLLFAFVLQNITETEVVDDLTTRVTMEVPWPAFPAYLFSTSRLGIMAQSQLDDAETCAQNPVGTGPFRFVNWDPNEIFQAERNEDYWQIAPDGEPYPYVDASSSCPSPMARSATPPWRLAASTSCTPSTRPTSPPAGEISATPAR